MRSEDKFFNTLVAKPVRTFDEVEFFKNAPFVKEFDFSNEKLAQDLITDHPTPGKFMPSSPAAKMPGFEGANNLKAPSEGKTKGLANNPTGSHGMAKLPPVK